MAGIQFQLKATEPEVKTKPDASPLMVEHMSISQSRQQACGMTKTKRPEYQHLGADIYIACVENVSRKKAGESIIIIKHNTC